MVSGVVLKKKTHELQCNIAGQLCKRTHVRGGRVQVRLKPAEEDARFLFKVVHASCQCEKSAFPADRWQFERPAARITGEWHHKRARLRRDGAI